MIRDPFYKQILEALGAELDPKVFELCAVDLLREPYPTIAPIPGGADDGMDAAIGKVNEPAIPVVCTTSQDVIGNLARSLKSFLKSGRRARNVVVATSQELTQRRRKNLERKADGLGFILTNIHAQSDIALRLYRNPRWCKELLGLKG